MDTNRILQADVLDILFEGRNKEYGAYVLRKEYNRRLIKALGVSTLLILLLVVCYSFTNHDRRSPARLEEPIIVDLINPIRTPEREPSPHTPPKARPPAPKIATVPNTIPRIVPNNEPIKEDEKPLEQKELDMKASGLTRQDGVEGNGGPSTVVAGSGNGTVESTANADEEPDIFRKVEIESTYPGDMPAWQRYLNKNFRYPDAAVDAGIDGTVVVRFIVDTDGNVSDVEAISGPETGGLREEAVRVIRKSGKWKPAIQNGRFVKSYKSQSIVFRLANQ